MMKFSWLFSEESEATGSACARSDFENAVRRVSSGWLNRSFSLLITKRLSTSLARTWIPSSARSMGSLPSKRNGVVTTATVIMPKLCAIRAMTGVQPVPTPPPRPASRNKIFVSPASALMILSVEATASSLANEGLLPVPMPELPNCRRTGMEVSASSAMSVSQAM